LQIPDFQWRPHPLRGNMVLVQPHKKAQKPGIGLYTYEQEKNSTPFAYFAQIVVGAVVASLGMVFGVRSGRIAKPEYSGVL
jgi:hypothetical protein